MRKQIGISAVALTFCVLASLGEKSEAAARKPAAAAAQLGDADLAARCKKTKSNACTSCAESGVNDIECKPGSDFKACSAGTDHICSNGASCDQAVGDGACR